MAEHIGREQQIAAIREVLDWLEAHPEVPMPIDFNGSTYARDYGGFTWHVSGDQKEMLATIARALPGPVEKDASSNGQFYLAGRVAGIRMLAIADRDQVCERIVVNTRYVTEQVPDPSAPLVTVTKAVDDVEWRCTPILDSGSQS